MPTFQVEMRWRCSTCEHENLGRHKECLNCGKPKGREEFYDAPGTGDSEVSIRDAVTDPELIKQAKAGADWECAFCKSHQRRDSGECVECGAPNQAEARKAREKWDWEASKKVGKPQRKQPEWLMAAVEAMVNPKRTVVRNKTFTSADDILDAVAEAERDKDIDDRVSAVEGKGYRGRAVEVQSDPGSTPPVEVEPDSRATWRPPFWTKTKKAATIGVLAATLIGVLCYFLFRTRIVDAEVTTVAWTHTVKVDRYQVVRQSGFDRPGDAFDVQSEGMRHHHYKQVRDGTKQVPYNERYACGTTPRVCRTTPVRCSTNNNGFKTCSGGNQVCSGGDTKYCNRTKYRTEPKYKDVSVKREHYRWKVWRWKHNRNVVSKGTTEAPEWPSEAAIALGVALGPEAKKERESGRQAVYEVTFTDTEGETYGYTPTGLDEFMELRPGVKHRIKVGTARSTEIVRPEDE